MIKVFNFFVEISLLIYDKLSKLTVYNVIKKDKYNKSDM